MSASTKRRGRYNGWAYRVVGSGDLWFGRFATQKEAVKEALALPDRGQFAIEVARTIEPQWADLFGEHEVEALIARVEQDIEENLQWKHGDDDWLSIPDPEAASSALRQWAARHVRCDVEWIVPSDAEILTVWIVPSEQLP